MPPRRPPALFKLRVVRMKALSLLLLLFAALLPFLRPYADAAETNPNPATDHKVDQFGDPLPEGAIVRLGTTRLRNGQGVEGVAFSPDSKTLVSCGWDNSIRFWDVATGAP